MSSIAYATDAEMMEYHRISRSSNMVFWRLSSGKKFSDFHKGDLIFFYTYSPSLFVKAKGLIGYAHYDSSRTMNLKTVWNSYGTATGYESKERLTAAIRKAGKGKIPEKMNCLLLKDIVFFNTLIDPASAGIDIPKNLESYCYIDKQNPGITLALLKMAKKIGIDLWAMDPDLDSEAMFEKDIRRHMLASVHAGLPSERRSRKESAATKKLLREKASQPDWEMIRGSQSECVNLEDDTIRIALAFAPTGSGSLRRTEQLAGRMLMYKQAIPQKVQFEILSTQDAGLLRKIAERLNDGTL
ncbi:MAG: hypothetical protein IKD69_14590 [Solobacterium sp.]|nr:hypothetical protein [Solobacterium sp.]